MLIYNNLTLNKILIIVKRILMNLTIQLLAVLIKSKPKYRRFLIFLDFYQLFRITIKMQKINMRQERL